MRSKVKNIFLGIVLMLTSMNGLATGIPVFDAASVMQAILSVQELKAQLEEQKRTYESMNGSRGLGQLLNDPKLKNYLPANWQKVYDSLATGGLTGLTGSAAEIRRNSALFDCARLQGKESQLKCERQAGKVAQDKAYGLDAYQQAESRISQIERLMAKIDQTSDPKAIAELNARLQAENALIQNEQIKLQMFQYLSQAEDKAIQQQNKEELLRDIHKPYGSLTLPNFK